MARRSTQTRILVLGLSAAFVAAAAPAFAEEPVETAIRGWVTDIDASPNWVAGYESLTYDDASRTATLKNLTIRSETLSTKIEISFGQVAVTGYGQTPDGGFTAVSVTTSDSRAVFGAFADVKLGPITADTLTVPSFTGFVFDPARPFTAMVKAYAIAAQTTIASLKIDSVDSTTTFENQTTNASYGGFTLTGMQKGMIDHVVAGPFTQETPSPDGLVNMRADKLEAFKMDLNAIIDVFDPDRYQGGVGDGRWRNALALEKYTNLSFEIPGGKTRFGSIELENLKVRQPPKSFTAFFDDMLANPQMSEKELGQKALDAIPNVFYAFGWDAFRFVDLDVTAPGVDRFHLGDFHINDYSSDGIGEIGIADLDVASDKTSVGAERAAMGGFKFPSLQAIVAAVKAEEAGVESDPLPLIPTMGFAEAVNVSVVQEGKTVGAVDRGRVDLGNYIGPVPTQVALDIRNLVVDQSLIDDARARSMFAELGYQQVQANYGFKLNWREADQSLTLSDFKFDIKDFGSIAAEAVLTGLTRQALENPKGLEGALPSLLFQSGKAVVKDGSIVDRAIAMEAKKKGQTPEKYREDLAGAMPLTLMLVLKNPGFQEKLAPALQAFIRTPGTMTLTASPATPVPLTKIIAAAEADPRSLPTLLSIDVKTDSPAAPAAPAAPQQ
ncbi:MAG: hypothetical protein J0I45_17655 [Bosea sp.]|nr:hypothetical protein [Bosea sp. (in: a-proteobacteria)]